MLCNAGRKAIFKDFGDHLLGYTFSAGAKKPAAEKLVYDIANDDVNV